MSEEIGTGAPAYEETAIYPRVIACALLFAERYFPHADMEYGAVVPLVAGHFLLTGQYSAWEGFASLSEGEHALLGRMLRHRANLLAVEKEFTDHAVRMLAENRILHFTAAGPDRAAPCHGGDALALAVELLDELDAIRAQAASRIVPAAPGLYSAAQRAGARDVRAYPSIDVRYNLQGHHLAPETEPVHARTAAALPDIELKIEAFLELAERIDTAQSQDFRSTNRLFESLRTGRGEKVDKVLRMRSGQLSVLSAPTGRGKSVMMQGLGPWCVQEDVTLALIVPNNVAALEMAYQITRDLRALGMPSDGVVVPLMSPDSMMDAADKATAHSRDPRFVEWVNFKLGYGCALAASAETDREVDAWVPGEEPCQKLTPVPTAMAAQQGRRRAQLPQVHTCPWHGTCGKHRLNREAATARIIVTTHKNFQVGQLRVPVSFDGGAVEERVSVEKLVLRRAQLIVIDEVDAFQSTALDEAGQSLLLVWGGHTDEVPLHQLDQQTTAAFDRVPSSLDEATRGHVYSARWISLGYANHLARGRLGTVARNSKVGIKKGRATSGIDQHPQWIVPNRWDAYLAVMLRAYFHGDETLVVTDPEQLAPEPWDLAVLDGLTARSTKMEDLPEHVRPVAEALRALTVPSTLGGQFERARHLLDQELGRFVAARHRPMVVDRILRRSYLVPLRSVLYWFVHNGGRLNIAGIPAAREIADALGTYSAWRAAPYGPQGRLMFAFTEHVPETNVEETRFSVAGFGGDPHVYTTGLGSVTALAQAGTPRIVLGLSATAFMPAAHRHHIHTTPTWWVPDEDEGGVTVRAEPVPGLDREMIRISGKTGPQRREATRLAGRKLGPRLRRELDALAAASPVVGVQDRVALATTSYESCRLLAEGLVKGSIDAELLCVGVRPDTPVSPSHAGAWSELPGDRLEEFGRMREARILIAPLGRIERSLNILAPAQKRSAIGSIWLVIRPVPLIDDPAELLAHVNAAAHAEAGTHLQPWLELVRRREVAGRHFDDLVNSQRYLQALPKAAQKAIAAELIITLIQLVGRARRGGTPGVLNLVDYAFLDPRGGSDLPRLIRELREDWRRSGALPQMNAYYGATLQAFFDFADAKDR